jgi:gluconate 2-dehydrogenase gamma chain
MSNENDLINPSRRDLFRNVALAAAFGGLSAEAAQHVHQSAADEKAATGAYSPKVFTDHEYKTLQRLSELIMPADANSKSALEAGAPEFIDLLSSQNPEMASIYTGGIGWLDRAMEKHYQSSFLSAKTDHQTAMLDLIAYRKNDSPELGPGIRFFDWARRMVVDAFYTSPIGVKDVGFMGNTAVSKFEVPPEAIDYALKRSGL